MPCNFRSSEILFYSVALIGIQSAEVALKEAVIQEVITGHNNYSSTSSDSTTYNLQK